MTRGPSKVIAGIHQGLEREAEAETATGVGAGEGTCALTGHALSDLPGF